MKIIIKENYDEMSRAAFEEMKEVVTKKPNAVLGLATGSTPLGLYRCMIEDHINNGTSYRQITTVNLDEYVGLDKSSDQSYVYFMWNNLFDKLDIQAENVNLPCGVATDLNAECARYTALLNEKKQDIQLLGLGANGHIGFNEPGSSFECTTQIIELKEGTRKDNARFFEGGLDEVPTKAITMGIKNIMNAQKVLVIASGKNKAEAVKAMAEGEITENCPASVLQNHPDVILVVDKDAASLLGKKRCCCRKN